MKTDRLIGILSILLQEEKTTAPELAERFEVSRRTINRDIEDLCRAGIPIRTVQGSGGGISIMDGYRMDRTILTSRDGQATHLMTLMKAQGLYEQHTGINDWKNIPEEYWNMALEEMKVPE